jgi:hypothetical protein
VPKRQKTVTYTYRGGVERGTGKSYAWREGFSETATDGGVYYPWMTRKECQADARAQGAIARFEHPRAK